MDTPKNRLSYSRVALPIALMLAVFGLTGCWYANSTGDTGTAMKESRPVTAFSKISIEGAGTLIIDQGEAESLEIEAGNRLMPKIQTAVVGNTLNLKVDCIRLVSCPVHTNNDITFRVQVRELDEIAIDGSALVTSSGLKTPNLKIDSHRAGKADMIIEATSLVIKANGSSSFNLAGTADGQSVSFTGSGNYRAAGLESRAATVRITGSGSATVNASESLDVTIAGNGRVQYLGTPRISQKVSGSGSISQLDEGRDSEEEGRDLPKGPKDAADTIEIKLPEVGL